MSHHLFNPQPIPRMRLIQEGPFPSIGPMPAYIGAAGNGSSNSVRDEFVEASGVAGAASRSQAVLMPAKPVPSVAKGPKGKRAAGVSPARANVTKKRKSSIMAAAATVAPPPPPPPPPPLPPGGVGVNPRPINCKYRNSYPLTQQQQHQPQQPPTQTRRRRTVEDFLSFCKMILDYENYTEQDEDVDRQRHSSSPLGSTGSSSGSGWEGPPPPPKPAPASSNELPSSSRNGFKNKNSPAPSSSPEYQGGGAATTEETEEEDMAAEEENDEDSWNSVTCFCKKPFAGRPMIECSSCYTWVHIKCAKLSRRKIPDVWFCQKCRVASPPPTQPSTSKAKGHNKADPSSSNGANKTKSSPVKQPAGARKRKSSLTSKRVVVIKDTSAPAAAAAAASADDDDYDLVLAPPASATASSSSPERPRTPVLAAADIDTTSATSSSPVTSSSPDGSHSRKWRPTQEVDEVSPGEGGDS